MTSRRRLPRLVKSRHTSHVSAPGQWQQFNQKRGDVPNRVGNLSYGVCCNGDDSGNFDYIAGVEVFDFSDLPREFARVRIPEQKYAVFTHDEHISTIRPASAERPARTRSAAISQASGGRAPNLVDPVVMRLEIRSQIAEVKPLGSVFYLSNLTSHR